MGDNTELYEKYREESIKEYEPATKKVHVDDKFVPKEYDDLVIESSSEESEENDEEEAHKNNSVLCLRNKKIGTTV